MTIVSGRTYAVESFHEFREALDVSWHELAQGLGENHQREMVRTANEGRAEQSGKTEAKSVKDLEEVEIAEHIEEWASFTDTRLMKPVLEARDQRYTFVVDGRTHRIIELTDERSPAEDMAVAVDLLTLLLSEQVPEVQGEVQRYSAAETALDYKSTLEMESGADVTGISVNPYSVFLQGQIKMGQGSRPYADDPTEHLSLLEHPTLADTEGTVVYEHDGGALSLPKFLYFEEEREFDENVETPAELAEAVANVLGFDIAFEWATENRPIDA
jgi:hypothetical protein